MDIIVDIDGTLANLDHRLKWIKNKPKNFNAFMENLHLDKCIEPIAWLVCVLHEAMDGVQFSGNIILCSGRSDRYKEETINWLRVHDIQYDELYMRKEGDYRQDYIIKKELLDQIRKDGYNPELAIDDRQQVVDMWRANGLICLQCAKGDF